MTAVSTFDESAAEVFAPSPHLEKTAILVSVPEASTTTSLVTPFGEQTMRGAFYVVAEGSASYGAAQQAFEATHRQVGTTRWVKCGRVEAYRATSGQTFETIVDGWRESSVVAEPGDWVVRQLDGQIYVVLHQRFIERYTPAVV